MSAALFIKICQKWKANRNCLCKHTLMRVVLDRQMPLFWALVTSQMSQLWCWFENKCFRAPRGGTLPGFSSQADSENPYFLAIYARSQHDFIGLSLFWPRFRFSHAITMADMSCEEEKLVNAWRTGAQMMYGKHVAYLCQHICLVHHLQNEELFFVFHKFMRCQLDDEYSLHGVYAIYSMWLPFSPPKAVTTEGNSGLGVLRGWQRGIGTWWCWCWWDKCLSHERQPRTRKLQP